MDHFTRGSYTFPVTDAGPADGETVVLLHGFPQSKESWTSVAAELHAAGYRTLAPDQRGYSAHARPRGRRAYRVAELVDDVLALIEASGQQQVHLVGHDWGAVVAWVVAAEAPERLASLTAMAVPPPAAFLRALATSRQAIDSWYFYLFQLPWLPERLFAPDAESSRARLRRFLIAFGQSADRADRDLDLLGDRSRLAAAIGWYRALVFLSPDRVRRPVRVPTRYLWATDDKAVSRKAAELAARYVQAPYEFHELVGSSHWFPEESPREVGRLLIEHLQAYPALGR